MGGFSSRDSWGAASPGTDARGVTSTHPFVCASVSVCLRECVYMNNVCMYVCACACACVIEQLTRSNHGANVGNEVQQEGHYAWVGKHRTIYEEGAQGIS